MNLPTPTPFRWSEDQINFAGDLWKKGWSAGQISKEINSAHGLNTTRNAIIGMLSRNGFAGRKTPARPTTYQVPRPKPKPRTAPIRKVRIAGNNSTFTEAKPRSPRVVIPFRDDGPGLRDILSVGHGECRWPCGSIDDDTLTFCGHDAPNGPYCCEHTKRAVLPSVPRSANDLQRSLRRYFA